MQIRGVLKPMPEYGVHFRAGVEIPKSGLKFVVDDEANKEFDETKEGPGGERLLVMSRAGYKYMKEASGQQIVIEPLEAAPAGSAESFEELEGLRQENEALHSHRLTQDEMLRNAGEQLRDASEQLAAAKSQLEQMRAVVQERDALKARVAELEAAAAKTGGDTKKSK